MIQLEFLDDIPSFGFAVKRNNSDFGCPSLKLSDPIRDGRIGNYDKSGKSFEVGDDIA